MPRYFRCAYSFHYCSRELCMTLPVHSRIANLHWSPNATNGRILILLLLAFGFATFKAGNVSAGFKSPGEISRAESTGGMKLKSFWDYEVRAYRRCTSKRICETYFVCNYTSQTCQSGYRSPANLSLFILLDGSDRKRVIGHFFCAVDTGSQGCFNFDSGKSRGTGNFRQQFTVDKDMPDTCDPQCVSNWARQNLPVNRQNDYFISLLMRIPVQGH